MKYGFILPGRGQLSTPESLGAIAKAGEQLGFDALLKSDHILVPRNIASPYPYTEGGEYPGSPLGESMEQITVLAYIAGQTSKIRLVTSVMIVPNRNPLIAAKSLATLDVLSGGRLVIGMGVGWMKEEFQTLGLPPFEERGAVTDEYIRAFKVLWTEDNPSFHGKYVSFENIHFLPKPVQKPHPPIWVGGESRPAMRRTAEFANGWCPLGSNRAFPMSTAGELKAGLERLAQYARRFGRDPSDIETVYRTHQFELTRGPAGSGRMAFVGDAPQIAGDIRGFQDAGVGSIVLDFIRQTDDLDVMLGRMEEFATQVWPKV